MKFKTNLVISMLIITILNIIPYKEAKAEIIDGINFTSIEVVDGLSQGTVEAIMQDKDGYMWIGTADGLNRYDGVNFKVYRNNRECDNAIVSNYINFIKEDHKGNNWVGTASGISKIGVDGKIRNYDSEEDGLIHYNICDLLIKKNGQVVIATPSGIHIYNEENDKFEVIYSDEIKNEDILTVDEDENGDLWVGTDSRIYKLTLDKSDFKKVKDINTYGEGKSIYKVVTDKSGYVWAGTTGEGLVKINIATDKETTYINNINDKKSLPNDFVKTILIDSNGTVWIGTADGLARYDKEQNSFKVYRSDNNDMQSLINDDVHTLFEDNSGLIWVGTYSGISIFNPNSKFRHYKYDKSEKNSISESSATALYEDNGMMWVGSRTKGISVINRQTGESEKIINGDGDGDLSNNRINVITGDENYIWIGTGSGLNRYDKKTQKIEKYIDETKLPSLFIKSLYLQGESLYIGTSEGLCVLNTKTNKITNLTDKLVENGLMDTYINTIYVDSDGIVWTGSFFEGGMMSIDLKNDVYKNYRYDDKRKDTISSNCINMITEDDDDNLLIATSYGINKFNKSTEEFTYYTESDGLSNNYVYSIIIDNENNIWASTNYGISKITNGTSIINVFTMVDGLQHNEFNSNASAKTKDGEIIFGGINGVNIFNPSDINGSEYKTNVIINDISVSGIEYKDIDNMQFDSRNNRLTVKFFLPDYRNTKNIKYFYKLEGVDTEMNITESNEVTYSNLKAGDYTFKVMARNHSGELSDETTFKFSIKPPFWKSKTFVSLIVMLIVIWLFYNNIRVKVLDKKVLEKTKKLTDEIEKNKELYNKVIELERNKNNYFINLSHELRTPLNVIISTEQLIDNLNNKDELTSKKLDHYINIMKRNSLRLLNLINNIIDTSKIESGTYRISVEEKDIVYIVEEATLSLKDYIENNGIELIIDPKIEEKIIECDQYEIERSIINLVSNAAKFTPKGGKIEVDIYDYEDSVYISVEDTGVGIDKKFQSKIFDRFNQVGDFNHENKGGSGLGLTITKQIIDLHHGNITVESEINKGCKFTIMLPIKQPK